MRLVIVESPTKAKTIGKFLGPDYRVESSYGHIRDLPKSKLGVDVDQDFAPGYVIPTKARKVVTLLKKLAAKSEGVILASDEDREGEAIAWHLMAALGLKSPQRIVFHEITKSAIDNAIAHPRELNLALVDAQQARRVLDRLVGYKLSPFLWKKVAKGLSAGRVQSVALRLVVDREHEIRNFVPQEYWSVTAHFAVGDKDFEAVLAKINGEALDKFALKNAEQANKIVADLKDAKFLVTNLIQKESRKNPLPPFTTSTLQQEGAKRLGFSAKKTMMLAQRLYESGHITYMRTDSVNLSGESLIAAREWLQQNFGEAYTLPAPRNFKNSSKLAQEAHEAVRPTRAEVTSEMISLAEPAEQKLYDLIWRRFMASQMPQAVFDTVAVDIEAGQCLFRANGATMKFDGFLKVWKQKFEERSIPELSLNQILSLKELLPQQHMTEPPPRYSEASLIKTLEEYGVGRPSTYAPIISVILARNYVRREQRRFFATEIGELVIKVLLENFPDIVNVEFTAEMEKKLDAIADGEMPWVGVIRAFYDPFAVLLAEKYAAVEKVHPEEATNEICEKCGKPMMIKFGRFGKFLACSGFPECKNTKSLTASGEREQLQNPGVKCPKCVTGDVVTKRVNRGRARGKFFWGCSRYPECDFATWENPAGKSAEQLAQELAVAAAKPKKIRAVREKKSQE